MNGDVWLGVLIGAAVAASCASTAEDGDERVGGETHWLGGCETDADCDRGACLCGVCTTGCDGADACAGEATCVATTNLLEGRCTAEQERVCLATCGGDADCASGTTCASGSCVSTTFEGSSAVDGGGGTGGEMGGSGGSSTGGTGGAVAGAGGAAGSAGGSSPNECGGSRQPTPPPSAATAGGDGGEIVAALYRVDLGDRARVPGQDTPLEFLDFGWDLDETCTTDADPALGACVLPPYSSGSVDGPEGVDNAFGGFVQSMRDVTSEFSSLAFTESIQAGAPGLLFRVRGYDGQVDDAQVDVAVFPAGPYAGLPLGESPVWDGTDIWPVASDSVSDPSALEPLEAPVYSDPAAHVAGGRLVARLPELAVRWQASIGGDRVRLDMNLTEVAIDCGMEPSMADRLALTDCTLGGRWEADDLLHQLSQLGDPTNGGTPLCTDNGLYAQFKQQLCGATDVASSSTAADRACTSLSVGVRFETRPALLGDLWQLDDIAPRCPEDTEPSNDGCSTLNE